MFKKIVLLLLLNSPLLASSQWLKFDSRPFRPLGADVNEIKFDYIVLNNNRVNATMGAHYPVYQYHKDDQKFQMGIFGLGFNRLNYDGFNFDLNSYDAIFGVYADYRKGATSFSLRYTHISTHLSEGVLVNGNEDHAVFRYSREHLRFLIDHRFTLGPFILRPYTGFTWVVAAVSPDELKNRLLIQGQLGAEVYLSSFGFVQPFVAFDLSAATEHNYFVNKSLVAGLRFMGDSEASFRLQFQYYKGKDPRGNFYSKDDEFYGAGIAYYF